MLLRNDWDKLLLAATRLMATNPSVLELYYDETVQTLEMTAQDYQNNTISLLISVPYLREYTSPENDALLALNTAVSDIAENWGEKINGFPSTYADEAGGASWLKSGKQRAETSYTFTLQLIGNNNAEIASKPITITYSRNREIKSYGWNAAWDDKQQWIQESSTTTYDNKKSSIIFKSIPLASLDSDELYAIVTYSGAPTEAISIQPIMVAPDADYVAVLARTTTLRAEAIAEEQRLASEKAAAEKKAEEERLAAAQKAEEKQRQEEAGRQRAAAAAKEKQIAEYIKHPEKGVPSEYAAEVIAALHKKETVKITGSISNAEFSSITLAMRNQKHKIHLDLSAVQNLSSIPANAFSGLDNLVMITLPSNIQRISEYAFDKCKKLEFVNFCGSKKQWKAIRIEKKGNKPLLRAERRYNYKSK